MKISVCIAVFNGASTIERAIRSTTKQDWPGRELVVADGGSNDGTVGILQRLEPVIDHWRSEPDRGIADAWNKAIARCTGDWIIFLGADDYFLDESALSRAAAQLQELEQDCLVAYADVLNVLEDGTAIHNSGGPWDRQRFYHGAGMYFSHQGVFHHRRLFSKYGFFDEKYRFAADYHLLLRGLRVHDPKHLPGPAVTAAQFGGISSSYRNRYRVLKEYLAARKECGVRGASPEFTRILWTNRGILLAYTLLGATITDAAIGGAKRLLGKN